jgi:hypothetical protein
MGSTVPDGVWGEEICSLFPNASCPDLISHAPVTSMPRGEKSDPFEGGAVGLKDGPVCDDWASYLGPPSGGGVNTLGPSFLKTRKGDLFLLGPAHTNPFLEVNRGEDSSAIGHQHHLPGHQQKGTLPCVIPCVNKKSSLRRAEGCCSKTHNSKIPTCYFSNPHMPMSRFLRFAGAIHGHSCGRKRRKAVKKGGKANYMEVDEGSDSIHCSSGDLHVGGGSPVRGVMLVPQEEQSSTHPLCSFVNNSVEGVRDPALARETEEAEKLMAIQQDLGVLFNGGEGEDLTRSMELERRDRKEKEDWELSMGYQ